MQRSLHIHSEHWQHSHSAGQIELTWVQNGPVVFETVLKHSLRNDNFASGDFIEQIEKLVRLLQYTTENCCREDQAWVHFVPSLQSKGQRNRTSSQS
jgi:hypothetical protein